MQKQSKVDQNQSSDEIDLIELIFSIWKKKRWVAVLVAFFAFTSMTYSFLVQEEWISTAEIVQPDAADMGFYLDRYEQYLSITNPNQSQKKNQNKNQEALEKILEATFSRFLSASGSYENHLSYFKQSIPDVSGKELIELLKAISINKPNGKKNIQHLTVSFSDERAQIAQKHLKGLIAHINHEVYNKTLSSLNAEIQTKIRALSIEQESIKAFADTSLSVRLKNLNKALQIASNAGIKRYSSTGNGRFLLPGGVSGEAGVKLTDDRLAEDNFLFMLGTDYLQAQIDALKNSETIYPERYYQAQLQANLLKTLLQEKGEVKFKAFSYQSAPSLPLQRSKPKRAFIVLIGTFMGLIFGVLAALLVSALEARGQDDSKLAE